MPFVKIVRNNSVLSTPFWAVPNMAHFQGERKLNPLFDGKVYQNLQTCEQQSYQRRKGKKNNSKNLRKTKMGTQHMKL